MVRLMRVAMLLLLVASSASAWESTRLSVPVMVNGHTVPYPVFSIFVMPGTAISVGFVDATGGAAMSLGGHAIDPAQGELRASNAPGLEVLEVRNLETGEICKINVFTLVPASRVDRNGRLNGYRIGQYPREPLRGLEIYRAPRGFIEVTEENSDTNLSPNFSLREFLTKQESDFPKYLVLRAELLLKLENILASLNRNGHP
ncbi:MAG: hypothetical protein R3192_17335, partial [Woeseiaceae bacterium]|nr:hypothetical protein [Woeseiaceae bacterium]